MCTLTFLCQKSKKASLFGKFSKLTDSHEIVHEPDPQFLEISTKIGASAINVFLKAQPLLFPKMHDSIMDLVALYKKLPLL